MGVKKKLATKLLGAVVPKFYGGILKKERELAAGLTEGGKVGAVLAAVDSPSRFEIPLEYVKFARRGGSPSMMRRRLVKFMAGSIRGIKASFRELANNPERQKREMDGDERRELEQFCHEVGVAEVAFGRVSPELVFSGRGVMFPNAVVLSWEMDRDEIEKAPSEDTLVEVQRTYRDLGRAANEVARFLREQGFGAQAIHPLGGTILTIPLAARAGMGAVGRQGLLVTPRFGPRVRLAAVLTSAENLPVPDPGDATAENRWISNFCSRCGLCAKKCPGRAVLEQPKAGPNGRLTHIHVDRCFPVFAEQFGCSVCIKVCPFSRRAPNFGERLRRRGKTRTRG
ncbi:MAG: hypothetical protein Kow0069_27910 [Promethearchaeota archaeon]